MNTYIEIAKGLMTNILYDNGYIDRWHSEESQISEKWVNIIAPIAGKFFDAHPDLLTEKDIENIASGGIEGDEIDDLKVIYKDYPDIQELLDILNEYLDDGCGVLTFCD